MQALGTSRFHGTRGSCGGSREGRGPALRITWGDSQRRSARSASRSRLGDRRGHGRLLPDSARGEVLLISDQGLREAGVCPPGSAPPGRPDADSPEALEGSRTRRGGKRCRGLHALSATGHKAWSPEALQREDPRPSGRVRTKLRSPWTPRRPVLSCGLATCPRLETVPYQYLKSSWSCLYSCLLLHSEDEPSCLFWVFTLFLVSFAIANHGTLGWRGTMVISRGNCLSEKHCVLKSKCYFNRSFQYICRKGLVHPQRCRKAWTFIRSPLERGYAISRKPRGDVPQPCATCWDLTPPAASAIRIKRESG